MSCTRELLSSVQTRLVFFITHFTSRENAACKWQGELKQEGKTKVERGTQRPEQKASNMTTEKLHHDIHGHPNIIKPLGKFTVLSVPPKTASTLPSLGNSGETLH